MVLSIMEVRVLFLWHLRCSDSVLGIFRRIAPYAASNNLRLMFLNMRDYPGSSRFTPEELEDFAHSDPKIQALGVRMLGRQVAYFLQHVIKEHALPHLLDVGGRRSGGLALLAWSYGNVWSMSMLSHASSLPDRTRETIGRYLRTVVLYGT